MENKYEAIYEVIQATVSSVETEVDFNGGKVTAHVPSLVVQLQPTTMLNDNSVIKLIFPGESDLAPFIVGENVRVTFESVANTVEGA